MNPFAIRILGCLILSLWASIERLPAETLRSLTHVANTTVQFPSRPPVSGYALSNALPGLRFSQPVAMAAPPAETNTLYIVERTGSIYVVTNLAEPSKTLFLDLSAATDSANVESGLLGMTFHPGYATNGLFFVYRTSFFSTPGSTNRFHDLLTRFQVAETNRLLVLTNTERVLLAQVDDSDQHNAGDLKFGPDGYLYVSLGERVNRDETWLDQTPIDRDLQGAILRIDVDGRPGNLVPNSHPASSTNYWIPSDNPFIGATQHHGLAVNPLQVRTELYAIGLRNPWKLSFDSVTGDLLVGDVGGNSYEEINRVVAGGDYGWPYVEGPMTSGFAPPPAFNPIPPLHTYPHGWSGGTNGDCVIGGLVYHGSAIPGLQGAYLFADFRSGYLWSLRRETGVTTTERLVGATIGLSSFYGDPRDGEILATHLYDGTIVKLIRIEPDQAAYVPPTLADTGIFENLETLTVQPGVIPYEINVPFWSDNAIKSRWFCLPEPTGKIGFSETNTWDLPEGAVWIKHFDLQLTNGQPASTRRIETRVIVKSREGVYGLTYRWGESMTNAWLVPEGGMDDHFTIREPDGTVLREQDWRYPSRAECLNCHTEWSGRALGFNTAQLNRDISVDGLLTNQIAALAAAGYLDRAPDPKTELPALAKATDQEAPLEFRVRSYLQANCAPCHVPYKHSLTIWDARLSTPLDLAALLPPNPIVIPGNLADSRLYTHLLGYPRLMPPIGTSVLNTNAINLVSQWITNLPPASWSYGTVGNSVHFGGCTLEGDQYVIGGVGSSLTSTNDSFEYLHHPLPETAVQVIARLTSQSSTNDQSFAGLMLREGTSSTAPHLMAALRGDGIPGALRRDLNATEAEWTPADASSLPQWLRLTRRGRSIEASHSSDGTNWISLKKAVWASSAPLEFGLAANSGSGVRFNNSLFDQLSQISVSLQVSGPTNVPFGDAITFATSITASGRTVTRVEFYDGDQKIGESSTSPFGFSSRALDVGSHQVFARAIDETGTPIDSEPVGVTIASAVTHASVAGIDAKTSGNWIKHYGKQGYFAVYNSTNIPSFASLSITGATPILWSANSGLFRDLVYPSTTRHIGAGWDATKSFSVNIDLKDGELHRVSLYCTDWKTTDAVVQKIECFDPATGTLLSSSTLKRFSSGKYVELLLRGSIEIRVTVLSGPGVSVSGIFIDPNENLAPKITLTSPQDGGSFVLPNPLLVEATASDSDGEIDHLDYFVDGNPILSLVPGSPAPSLTNLLQGNHTIMVRAYDDLGDHTDSGIVNVEALSPRASGTFLYRDTTSRGSWTNRYGGEGFLLDPMTNRWPQSLPYSVLGASQFPLYGENPDFFDSIYEGIGALPLLFSPTPITYQLDLIDGHPRRVSLYFYDDSAVTEVVSLIDTLTGQVLDRATVTNGAGGVYMVFSAQGHVSFRIENPAAGAVQSRVSGLFLDPLPNPVPQVKLLQPDSERTLNVPAKALLMATNLSSETLQRVDYFTVESGKIGSAVNPPYEFLWQYPVPGDHHLFARAIAVTGTTADSPLVPVHIIPRSNSKARFVGTDAQTGWTWRGTYGTEGYWMPTVFGFSNLPPSIVVSNSQVWTEYGNQSTTGALQWPTGNGRLLSFWNGGTNWSFQVGTTDGRPHRFSIYNFAGTWTNRITLRLRSADGETVLDTRDIPDQANGRYFTWDLEGTVIFEVLTDPDFVSFINAIFVDPTPNGYDLWLAKYFDLSQQASPLVSDPTADPDGDGVDNWAEYCMGGDPAKPGAFSPTLFEMGPDGLTLRLTLADVGEETSARIETSTDLQQWVPATNLQFLGERTLGDTIQQSYTVPSSADAARYFRLRFNPPW